MARMAKLRSELPFYRHCLDQSPLSHAPCDRADASPDVVQFCASVFCVVAPAFYRLDGRKQIGAAASFLLCGSFLPDKHDLHVFDSRTY